MSLLYQVFVWRDCICLSTEFFFVFIYITYCVLRFGVGKATRRGDNTSANKEKELFAIIVNLFPQKGIFTTVLEQVSESIIFII